MKKLILIGLVMASCGRGRKGDMGNKGDTGANGTSCSVSTVALSPAAPNGGALVTCGATQSLILNGSNGVDGEDAEPSAYSIAAVIDPCGKQSSYDEVLLRLQNGTILASFSNNSAGDMTRLVVIGQGSFITTDSTGCHFSIDANGNVTW